MEDAAAGEMEDKAGVEDEDKKDEDKQTPALMSAVAKKLPGRPSQVLSLVPSHEPLTQDAYWKAMQSFLRPGDVIVVEDGTSSAGFGRDAKASNPRR